MWSAWTFREHDPTIQSARGPKDPGEAGLDRTFSRHLECASPKDPGGAGTRSRFFPGCLTPKMSPSSELVGRMEVVSQLVVYEGAVVSGHVFVMLPTRRPGEQRI